MYAGYDRMKRSTNGTLLTFEEFWAELENTGDERTLRQLYDTLCKYVQMVILSPYGVYQYARFRWCLKHPEAAIACQTGPKQWKISTCDEVISEDRALLLINSEFGFEASRIRLLGTPYYDATDWNFIRFRCGPYDWLMQDGELYQIYP